MRDFPTTSAAVNLLLIVALAIQPVAPCLAGLADDACCRKQPAANSDGRSCCAMGVDGDCCCCAEPVGDKPVGDKPAAAGCCGGQADSAAATSAREEAVSDGDEVELASLARRRQLRATCLCGLNAPPLHESPSRTRISVQRAKVVFALPGHVGLDDGGPHRLASTRAEAEARLPAHFSQRLLCIWRL